VGNGDIVNDVLAEVSHKALSLNIVLLVEFQMAFQVLDERFGNCVWGKDVFLLVVEVVVEGKVKARLLRTSGEGTKWEDTAKWQLMTKRTTERQLLTKKSSCEILLTIAARVGETTKK